MSPPRLPLASPRVPGTSPGALPGRSDDLLLLEHRGNASLCALERGTCTPLASFTSTVRGRDPCMLAAVAPLAQSVHPCHCCRERDIPGCWSRSCSGTWQRGTAGRSVWAAVGQQAGTGQCVTCPRAHRSGTLRTALVPCSGPVPCTSVSVRGAGVGLRGGTHPMVLPGRRWGLLVGGCQGPLADADPTLQTCMPAGPWHGWGCCWGPPASCSCSC